jgi:dihydroorotase (multifunctional complex type)
MALKKFPGFIDVHVHLREPGATHKEDFYSGSRAAIKGGFTFILDMPNNPTPTISRERLEEKISLSKKAICKIGFHFGTNGKNLYAFSEIESDENVFGLKIYCNHTTGEMLIEDALLLEGVFKAWKSKKPILLHAEGVELARAISLGYSCGKRIHVCHISQEMEVALVREAKKRGQNITAGVTPHHLFLSEEAREKIKGYAVMKPPLGTKKDQEALWHGLKDGTIDIVETDHAPHTKEEKEKDPPAFGVPGLETAAGLLFKAVKEGRIREEDVIKFLYENPRKIFEIPETGETYITLDPEKSYIIGSDGSVTKCGWSPFDGCEVYGKVETVVIDGKQVLAEGKIL